MINPAEGVMTSRQPIYEQPTKTSFLTLVKQLYAMVAPYWKSEERLFAWTMLAVILALNIAVVYELVWINTWNGEFYNSLQELNKDRFYALIWQFFLIVGILIVTLVSEQFLESYLAFNWRVWLTKQVMGDWLHNSTFSLLFTTKAKTENPDQRISQDLANFTTKTLSLGTSIFNQTIRSITFAIILWELSSSMLLPLPGGTSVVVPGYLLWLTIIYVIFATYIIYRSGKQLVSLDYAQEKFEANFRFNLMRIRERRDEVSILHGGVAETKFLNRNLLDIVGNFKRIIKRNVFVNSYQNFFDNLTTVLPILAAAPMFFAGAIKLGVLMQIYNAFTRVQGALMAFALNFQDFASWKANFNRIIFFRSEMSELTPKLDTVAHNLQLNISATQKALHVSNLVLQLPELQQLVKFDFSIQPHEHVLIMGRSGLGKTTLLKCIAGYWPFAQGRIDRPDNIMIIPQKPYFPIATLREGLLYPNLQAAISDVEIKRALKLCHLENLADTIYEIHDWNSMLSLGEQQRLNFARVILARPEWVIMDEPTASMDKHLEGELFRVLYSELPYVTLLTIGHAPSLKEYHTRTLQF